MTQNAVITAHRRKILQQGGAVMVMAGLPLVFPGILRAQGDVLKIGHLTPRTGFLGQIGEQGYRGAQLAVAEANTTSGVLGRKVELVAEDSVNPTMAATKAQKMAERDKVLCFVGEVNSASALALADQAQRYKIPFFNTGANSDALRGDKCNRFMFHVGGCNTMYTKTIGGWLRENNYIKGSRFYFVTADHTFGHDMFRGSSKFIQEHGGVTLGNDMVPTNTADYAPFIAKLKSLKPDWVYLNLSGVDQTTFLKQYKEFNLPFSLTGGVMDTVPFWRAGAENLSGHWQSLWFHGLKLPAAQGFTKRFMDKYGSPPDNQAWCDYVGVRILLQSMTETRSTESTKIIEHLESGVSFDLLKERKGSFRKWDHQLLQEMYVVSIKHKARDRWDIFDLVQVAPGPKESLDVILPTPAENACKLGA